MEKANAQTLIIERDIARLADDHVKLTTRFDRHLEIYAQNGKELAKLTSAVESLKETFEKRNVFLDNDQANQWKEIKTGAQEIQENKLAINSIGLKVAMWAGLGSTVGSAVVVAMTLQVFGLS